jgi:glycosyltransferase involved in cell wall biosynthesis
MIKKAWLFAIKQVLLTDTKKNLVILTPGFAKDETDSTCLPMQQAFILTLKKLFPHLDITILAFQYPYHSAPYTWHGISVIPFNGRNKGGLKKILLFKKINSVLRSMHSKNKINGILSFWYTECGYVGKKFSDQNNIKHCCWLWGRDAAKENKFPRRLKPDPNELVALSDFLQDEFEKNHGVRPMHVVPPGIDAHLFSTSLPARDIDILGTGSLIPLKRYDIFINVIAEIKKQLPGIKVILVGNGSEKKNLDDLVTSLGFGSNITITTELSYPEVLKHMQRAKIFLHTSSFEGFGAVCLEALHAGAQVVSFTKPMYAEIPHWQIAVDKDDMLQKAIKVLNDPATDHRPVTPYRLDDSVRKMMLLFEM